LSYSLDYKRDYTGGENSYAAPDELLANQSLIFENADILGQGGFTKRTGIDSYIDLSATYASRVDRLIEFEYRDTYDVRVLKKLALIDGNLIDLYDNSVIKSGMGNWLDFETYKDDLYILANGMFLVYNGTTIDDVVCGESDSNLIRIRKCKSIEQRGQRFFACGNAEDPNALYYSEVGRPDYWNTVNVIQAITDDADELVAVREFHGALLAFKKRAIYAWFGYDPNTDVEFQQLAVHTGTSAARTIQRVEDMMIYLGDDGVYGLVGTVLNVIQTRKLSKNITPRIKNILHSAAYYTDAACAIYKDGKYMLSVPTVTASWNDTVLVLFTDFLTDTSESWGVYTGWNVSEFLKSFDGELYSANSNSSIIHKHSVTYNDLGVAISVHVKTNPLSQGEPIKNKRYRYGYAYLPQLMDFPTTATIHAIVDYQEVDTTISPDESLLWDVEGRVWEEQKWDFIELVTRKFAIKSKGKRIVIDITNDILDTALTIYGFGLEYRIKKPDRN